MYVCMCVSVPLLFSIQFLYFPFCLTYRLSKRDGDGPLNLIFYDSFFLSFFFFFFVLWGVWWESGKIVLNLMCSKE